MKMKEAIIVEGIYDKKKLENIVEATIVPTYGFSIFTDDARLSYIRALAEKNGIITLTDADAAGQKIRHFLEEKMPPGTVHHAFIPGIVGKEKRKSTPSSAGFLGVEGVPDAVILDALLKVAHQNTKNSAPITTQDFYAAGLLGNENSKEKRRKLASLMLVPPNLSTKALQSAVNALLTLEEFKALCEKLK